MPCQQCLVLDRKEERGSGNSFREQKTENQLDVKLQLRVLQLGLPRHLPAPGEQAAAQTSQHAGQIQV